MATPSNQLSIGGLDSDIPILPPLLFLSFLVFSIILQKFASLPLPFLPKSMKSWVNRISMFVMLLAVTVYVMRSGTAALDDAGSGVAFTEVNGLAVDIWPYNTTRNPLYCLILLLAFPAFAILLDSLWMLLFAMPFFLYIDWIVIPAEEKLLANLFQEDYMAYKESTPRWLL